MVRASETPQERPEMSEEIWKPIPGLAPCMVSSHGRVIGVSGKILKGVTNNFGYRTVGIRKRTLTVHRLMLLAFVGPSEMHCNHKNGIKADNRLENLEYVTRSENTKHAIDMGLQVQVTGTKHHSAKLDPDKVREIRKSKLSHAELGRRYGVCFQLIYQVRKGMIWKHVK